MKTIYTIIIFALRLLVRPFLIAKIWGMIAYEFNLPPFGFTLFFLIELVLLICSFKAKISIDFN